MSQQMNTLSLRMLDSYRVDLCQHYHGDNLRGLAQHCSIVDSSHKHHLSATTSFLLGSHTTRYRASRPSSHHIKSGSVAKENITSN